MPLSEKKKNEIQRNFVPRLYSKDKKSFLGEALEVQTVNFC